MSTTLIDTPETDTLEFHARWGTSGDDGYVVHSESVRELERNLTAAKAQAEADAKRIAELEAEVMELAFRKELQCDSGVTAYEEGYEAARTGTFELMSMDDELIARFVYEYDSGDSTVGIQPCGVWILADDQTGCLITSLQSALAQRDAAIRDAQDAVGLLLPLAKGYAYAHPKVESNQHMIAAAERWCMQSLATTASTSPQP